MTTALTLPARSTIDIKLTDIFNPRAIARVGGREPSFAGLESPTSPHIKLDTDEPGIRGLFRFRPETALPLAHLSEVLFCGDSTLSRADRELIAAYVSSLNECRFCYYTHAAFAAARLPEGMDLVDQICADLTTAPVSNKMKALLSIAGSVQESGRNVTKQQVAQAKSSGATDVEIHDTVLIAAAFCMYNRYVDGLATFAPDDPEVYVARAQRTEGYLGVLAADSVHAA
ncbi:carboxymuconolactone decarboxylase family protein [Sphaerisporangium sp. TRM90804]|uniref:carboxymuconolactone decarboxylase family protein n=1 Tax=Sphaerisporangium sp. TRM90804 TaxID=3031113 RepID=UPI00244947B0|nr:carboxymuconolactone decarboxylase family protein [Sphaerisporangium sp. TRM90804]MDH2429388.1 carboxymuconolactone decarboxylase family protein [Sphaerisporangium sp. TRM90804]